jgi:hypothetical protein
MGKGSNNFERDLRIGKIKNMVQFGGSFRGFERINISIYRPCVSSNIAIESFKHMMYVCKSEEF